MMSIVAGVFWVSAALIAYTYIGFPLLLVVRNRVFRRPPRRVEIAPSVTLVIAAYNEAAVIRSRLENVLALDYPRDRLKVLVVSDGSDDGTVEIVEQYSTHGIGLLTLPRVGKLMALNMALPLVETEIVAFSDANSMCPPDALRKLVRAFADPQVGGVAGRQTYTRGTAQEAERAYWKFNASLGALESAAGSITNATGALYAIRRELFRSIPPGTADDVANSFSVLAGGYRMIYEPEAVAAEDPAPSYSAEFQRKVRICSQGWRSLAAFKTLLNPFQYGFLSFQLFSRKVLRWLMPWPLAALFVSSLLLARNSLFYGAIIILQAGFYAAALWVYVIGEAALKQMKLPRAVALPFFFCLGNLASLRAQWLTFCGARCDRWDTTPRVQESASEESFPEAVEAPAGKFAYIMSRFPKITETFILYEILELQRRGNSVEVYPLMREREAVVHPEAVPLCDQVHFQPFFSLAILRANLHYMLQSPGAYFGALWESLRGTFGSANFFIGAIAFFPKSAAFALNMERGGITHIHAHFATHPTLSALIIHRLTGIPYSFTAHGHDVQTDLRMLDDKLAAAKFAVAISRYNRDLMMESCGSGFEEKIRVIHCGVDTAYFSPFPVASAEPMRIICVAALRDMKGHDYLVEAARILHERGIRFHCDLVGEGALRKEIETLITRMGVDDMFTLHGAQPRNAVRRMLLRSDVKVLPSIKTSKGLREGIPVALMEAMACGLPVVSTELSGIPELVENGVSGILVKPCDAAGLADALEQLSRDAGLRSRMGISGRERVLREFDLERNTEVLARLFSIQPVAEGLRETSQAA